ncbi:T7SS effector LXG polymorphic toxin [Metabacillus bambusae]|uniref:Ribonuclease YeeF family protein n=1 Tax=Metabacillus bambusae TaxID=2795218 RepID=A0ABS3N304_9BACI|nr:T7SS effector LXG polymorphic toxin [Metabacillus bambusae]MBO1512691.1 ribonuclease YeeF family protein [Metabacillus bambusae]
MTVKVYEAKTLIDSMEARSKSYNDLRGKLEQVKSQFNDIVNLDDQLQGKGADAIKGFYQAQMDVAEAWLRLIDRNIAFFNGITGTAEDKDLSGDTVVHVPFLEDELTHHARSHKEMVSSQRDELKRIFNRIDDLISLDVFSKEQFDEHMEKAEKDRKDTADAVDQIDNNLKSEYILSEGDEQYVVALFQQLMEASRQGSNIQPIHFNAEAYKASDVYQLKEQAEKQTKEYLSFKDEQEKFREQLKRQEELENRPWYEKTWDGIKTFTGELTGYYDYIRASEGVDPVTGEKLTTGQRVAAGAMAAAGFIPVVGWAGRIVKGGGAIYKTAKGMHAADQALDVYRTANTFSTLEKAEMGIYGLVSANGFSEYLTGKDMFGNELTEEQQKNSLYQALGLLAVGGGAYYVNKLQADNAVYQAPKGNFSNSIDAISEADRAKLDGWAYPPNEQKYLKYKEVYDNPKYYDQETGNINWPPNNGFEGKPIKIEIERGTVIDRYGAPSGTFVSPAGIPYEQRALALHSDEAPYHKYEILEPFGVESGKIAPWFDRPGGGTQYYTGNIKVIDIETGEMVEATVENLEKLGYIREIK